MLKKKKKGRTKKTEIRNKEKKNRALSQSVYHSSKKERREHRRQEITKDKNTKNFPRIEGPKCPEGRNASRTQSNG